MGHVKVVQGVLARWHSRFVIRRERCGGQPHDTEHGVSIRNRIAGLVKGCRCLNLDKWNLPLDLCSLDQRILQERGIGFIGLH